MQPDLIDWLVCPAATGCRGRLEPAAVLRRGRDGELLDGFLACRTCGQRYPVLEGLAILVPDPRGYLRRAYATLVAMLHDDELRLSPAMRTALDAWLPRAAVAPTHDMFDADEAIARYLTLHYDSPLDYLPDGHPVRALAAARTHDGYARLADALRPHLLDSATVLDLGCNVGRMTLELAPHSRRVVGIELALRAAQTARRIVTDHPRPLDAFARPVDGLLTVRRPIVSARPGSAEVIVADAAALPCADGACDAAAAAALIDMLPDPRGFLAEQHRVLRPGAPLGLTTPFHWSAFGHPPETWLGGVAGCPSPAGLRTALHAADFDPCLEQDGQPWIHARHDRCFMVLINTLVVACRGVLP